MSVWRKSTYSDGNGGDCVELTSDTGIILVRDTTNLAGVLAEQGQRVLLIDCDSQGDLSSVFLDRHEHLPHTVADLFADTGILAEDLIQPTPFAGISIIPADRRLELFEQTHGFKREELTRCLAKFVGHVHLEVVLIQPGLGSQQQNRSCRHRVLNFIGGVQNLHRCSLGMRKHGFVNRAGIPGSG